MNEYTVEANVTFNNEQEMQLLEAMKKHGEITGTSGGFPVCPMVYKWTGSEEGVAKIKSLGATIL